MNVSSRPIPFERIATRCLDFSIVALLVVLPFALGGRHPVAKLLLACLMIPGCLGVLFKALSGHRIALAGWQLAILLACFAVPVLQFCPLPTSVVENLAPGLDNLFDQDNKLVAALNVERQFSLAPQVTYAALPVLVCYLAAFVCLVVRLESEKDIEQLFILLAGSALLLCVVAMLQAKFGNNHFLWLYDHPSRQPEAIPRGPFQNENHLCHLLALAVPVALYFLFRSPTGQSNSTTVSDHHQKGVFYGRVFSLVCLVAIVCTVYATPSRGGAAIVLLSVSLWAAFLGLRYIGLRYCPQHMGALLGWSTIGGVVATLAGFAYVLRWMPELSYWRAKLWAADLQVWQNFPVLGTGVGTHRFVYRAFIDEHYHRTFSVGESSWITLFVETGLVGVLLAVLVVVVIAYQIIRRMSRKHSFDQALMLAALASGLLVSCIHSLGDFPWYIPACLLSALALAAVATRLSVLAPPLSSKPSSDQAGPSKQVCLSNGISLLVSTLLVAGVVWAASRSVAPAHAAIAFDEYQRVIRDAHGSATPEQEERAAALLNQTVDLDPNHVLAQTKIAVRATTQLNDPSLNQADVYAEAFKQSVLLAKLCPVESRAYYCAAVSGVGVGLDMPLRHQLLQQSKRLRRVDGRVSMQLALHDLIQGNHETADAHWRAAIEEDIRFRSEAIKAVIMLYGPTQIIQRLQPSSVATAELFSQVVATNRTDDIQTVAYHFSACLLNDAKREPDPQLAEQLYTRAIAAAERTGNVEFHENVIRYSSQHHADPIHFRLVLADWFIDRDCEAEAAAELKDCLADKPGNDAIDRVTLRFEQRFRRSLH